MDFSFVVFSSFHSSKEKKNKTQTRRITGNATKVSNEADTSDLVVTQDLCKRKPLAILSVAPNSDKSPQKKNKNISCFCTLSIRGSCFLFFFFHHLWSRFRTPVETGAMSAWRPPLPSPRPTIFPPSVWRQCYLFWQMAAVCRASPSAPAADSALCQTQTRPKIEHPPRFATIKLAEMKHSCTDLEFLCW